MVSEVVRFRRSPVNRVRSVLVRALTFCLLLAGAAVPPPKPLNGYAELVVEAVTIGKGCDFSRVQSDILRKSLLARLRGRKIFIVVDCASADEMTKNPPSVSARRARLTAVVISFDAGSHTARAMGIGAGATKLRVRFTLTDAASGKEILAFERAGKFSGRFGGDGATNERAFSSTAAEVVDGVIQEIEKNR